MSASTAGNFDFGPGIAAEVGKNMPKIARFMRFPPLSRAPSGANGHAQRLFVAREAVQPVFQVPFVTWIGCLAIGWALAIQQRTSRQPGVTAIYFFTGCTPAIKRSASGRPGCVVGASAKKRCSSGVASAGRFR